MKRSTHGKSDSDHSSKSSESKPIAKRPASGDAQNAKHLDMWSFFERNRIRKQRKELSICIGILSRWFRTMAGGEVVLMVPGIDFSKMDSIVRAIASNGRKRPPVLLGDCYVAADRHYKRCKLLKTIKSLLKRAEEIMPLRPVMAYLKLAQNKSRLGKLADKFVQDFSCTRKQLKKPEAVHWNQYAEVFQNVLKIPVLKARYEKAASPEVVAYAVFLELDRDDRIWCDHYSEAVFAIADWLAPDKESELLKIAPCIFETARLCLAVRPSRREELKKAQARNRQTKHRKSKARAESKEPK